MPSQDSQGRTLRHIVSIVADVPITAVEGLTTWPMSTRVVTVYPCDVARACRDVVQEAGIVPIARLCTAVAAQQQESDPAERMAAEQTVP